MKLAKIRQADGREAVGLVEGDCRYAAGGFGRVSDAERDSRSARSRGGGSLALNVGGPRQSARRRAAAGADRSAGGLGGRRDLSPQPGRADGRVAGRRVVLRPGLRGRAAGAVLQGHAAPRRRPGQSVRIRQDANWNVPEPELALVLNSRLQLVGFTIGNDMSSRDIEGENPLYLTPGQSSTTPAAGWARGSRWRRHAEARGDRDRPGGRA